MVTARWMPARVVFFVARYAASCFWCGETAPKGSSLAYYIDEKRFAHSACHQEGCS